MFKKTNIQKLLEAEATKFIEESTKKIPKILEDATLSLLWLERDFHRWYEIDHCNWRNSVLIDAFRRIAQKEAEKIASTYKPSKEDIASFQEAFAKEYKIQMSYCIRDLAKTKAIADAKIEIDKVFIDAKAIIEEVTSK